ncbi:MAG TPA: DUF4139 domain-containing protein [Candidatus Binatia bacterium]|jgi:hypothetical protein|nr:DUF4139 domain-containing protein [Candidatus Binatia bacterium]
MKRAGVGIVILIAIFLSLKRESGLAARPRETAAVTSITHEQQKGVSLTVYNQNLGLVKDSREIYLGNGVQEIRFMDVASQINPTTVHLKSLTDSQGLRILEQNYEYDLLNPQKLLDKYVGKKIKILDKNYYTGEEKIVEATLLSTNGGPIYQVNGSIHLGHPGRVILPEIPENLIAKPTLVWLLQNRTARAQAVEASYLTGGISWKADYVFVLNPKDNGGDLSGWVTIDNKSGATYKDATLKLVAGDIHRARSRNELHGALETAAKAAPSTDRLREFAEEGFFEYHLYTLQGKSTIKDNQTKQLSLLNATDVPVQKQLIYYGAQHYYRSRYGEPVSNQKIGVYLEMANRKENRLGLPLPKGIVRVYKADESGSLQFVGEDWIDHTPKDEKVKIKMGEAFDVVGERIQKDWRQLASNLYEVEWEIKLRNHKKEDAKVKVIEPVPGDWEILRSSHNYEKIEAHTLQYLVDIPKDKEVKINYRVRIKF